MFYFCQQSQDCQYRWIYPKGSQPWRELQGIAIQLQALRLYFCRIIDPDLFLYNFHFKEPLRCLCPKMFKHIQKMLSAETILDQNLQFTDKVVEPTSSSLAISRVLHFLNTNKAESFIDYYMQNRGKSQLDNEEYFKALIQLLILWEGQLKERQAVILKQMLLRLLQIQQYSLSFVNLVPRDLFLSIKKYNPITFERREKKVMERVQGTINRRRCYNEQTKGYAEAILALNIYFNDPQAEFEDSWRKLLLIVGKYDLDFDKIADIILQYLPSVREDSKVLEIVSQLSKDKLKLLLAKRIKPDLLQDQHGCPKLKYWGPIQELIGKSLEDLFLHKIISFNPAYLDLLRRFLKAQLFRIQDFDDLLPSINEKFLLSRQKSQLEIMQSKINKIVMKSTEEMESQQARQTQEEEMFGQVSFCYKLALMYSFIKANQFKQFKRVYQSLTNNRRKLNLLMFLPLLKILCEYIEWMVEPILGQFDLRQHFKHCRQTVRNLSFPKGDIQQIKQINKESLQLLRQILSFVGINLGYSMKTFIKVCRVLRIYLSCQSQNSEEYRHIKEQIGKIIQSYLLGSVSLQDHTFPLVFQLQSSLKYFSQVQRFRLYSYYMKNVLFENVYLISQFENSKLCQQIVKRTTMESREYDAFLLSKISFNHPFRSCHFITIRLTEESLNKDIAFFVDIVSQTSFLLKDVMLYFCLDYLANNEQVLLQYYDIPTFQFRMIAKFIGQIYRFNPELEYQMLFEMAIDKLKQKIEEPPATEENIVAYNQNLFYMKIIAYLMEEMCPSLLDIIVRDINDKCEFLLYGYYLKMQISGKIEPFYQKKQMRRAFYNCLCKKRSNGYSYLFDMLTLTNSHLKAFNQYSSNHQESASISLQKHARTIEQCSLLLNHLIKLACLQYQLADEDKKKGELDLSRQNVDERNNLAIPQQFNLKKKEENKMPLSYDEIFSLAAVQDIELGLACIFYREYFKADIQDNNLRELRSLWINLINSKRFITHSNRQRTLFISQNKINSFIKSQFFFYFWVSSTCHLVSLEKKYCTKITELRRLIGVEQRDNEGLSRKERRQARQSRKYLMAAIAKICDEKEDLTRAYQKFNFINPANYSFHRHEKGIKFKISQEFLGSKDKEKGNHEPDHRSDHFKEFISIFFNYCLLPRMLIDPSQAIFCSRFLLRTIQENKIPSNKSLMMIFNCIEGAVDYVQYCTEREATKCIPIFVNDLLAVFKNWNNQNEIRQTLLHEINMEVFNDKRYQILKDFIFNSLCNINEKLIMSKREPYIVKNILSFIEKTAFLPLCFEQGQELFLNVKIAQEEYKDDIGVKKRGQRIQDLLRLRMKGVPTMKNVKENKNMHVKFAQVTKAVGAKLKSLEVGKPPTFKNEKKTQKKKDPHIIIIEDD